MAKDATANGDSVAVLERLEHDAARLRDDARDAAKIEKKREKAEKKKQGDITEREIEFDTPFGKIELEFEPRAVRDEKARERQARSRQETAKRTADAAQKAAAKAKRNAEKRGGGGRGGTLMLVLLIVGGIAALVVVAYWLFARPGPVEDDAWPPALRAIDPDEMAPPPTFTQRMRARLRDAVRAGRSASREAQEEQQVRYEKLTSAR
ncbi:MAG TPA: hypothetical protein VIH21_04785 [Dehalococcoidia bacterium]|jgi:hypothetical protein